VALSLSRATKRMPLPMRDGSQVVPARFDDVDSSAFFTRAAAHARDVAACHTLAAGAICAKGAARDMRLRFMLRVAFFPARRFAVEYSDIAYAIYRHRATVRVPAAQRKTFQSICACARVPQQRVSRQKVSREGAFCP